MDIETATNEMVEQQLLDHEAAIARRRAAQMVLLREVDRRQAPMAAGCGSLGEWVRGRIVIDALEAKADTFSAEPETVSRAARNADALWAISLDTLHGGDGASIEESAPVLTVFVDANDTAASNGQAGVTVAGGPRVGVAVIEAILCDGVVEITARTKDGVPLTMGRRTRAISPQLRRFILDRDGAACTIAVCTSKYRLQVHHIKRWVDGGRTDPENLTTVCWFHHHIVIHGQGFRIDPSSPPQRRRLLQPPIHGPPWLEHARQRGMVVSETAA